MRPQKFDDIIGQKKAKNILTKVIDSARHRNDAIPHVLLSGPAGTGKTTFSGAIANELGTEIHFANGVNLSSPKSVLPHLARVKEHHILFIDEVHRIRKNIQEMMYTVMEDFRLDIGKMGNASINYDKFAVIGATTDAGLLLKPFRDRFVYNITLTDYQENEMAEIIRSYSIKFGLEMATDAIVALAGRCRGVPRIAVNYLKWIRDYCISEKITRPNPNDIWEAMNIRGVDSNGMTEEDRRYIAVLKRFGKAVGLKTLASALDMDVVTIENIIEPWLIQKGLINKTSKGRELC